MPNICHPPKTHNTRINLKVRVKIVYSSRSFSQKLWNFRTGCGVRKESKVDESVSITAKEVRLLYRQKYLPCPYFAACGLWTIPLFYINYSLNYKSKKQKKAMMECSCFPVFYIPLFSLFKFSRTLLDCISETSYFDLCMPPSMTVWIQRSVQIANWKSIFFRTCLYFL